MGTARVPSLALGWVSYSSMLCRMMRHELRVGTWIWHMGMGMRRLGAGIGIRRRRVKPRRVKTAPRALPGAVFDNDPLDLAPESREGPAPCQPSAAGSSWGAGRHLGGFCVPSS